MGCDIHGFIEVTTDDGAIWYQVKAAFPNPYVEYEPACPLIDDPFPGRNYWVFSLLADVRNGIDTGWFDLSGGFPTGHQIEPISKPRGWSDDISAEVRQYGEEWGPGLHSHSWLLLRELVETPLLDQTVRIQGLVAMADYERMLNGGDVPGSWSGGIGGPGVRILSPDQYAAEREQLLRDSPAQVGIGGVHVQATWHQPLRDALSHSFLSTLAGLAETYDWDRTRYVFAFDS